MSNQGVPSYGSSSSSSSCKYDVFISFRGEDTRKRFTDHLYKALTREGIIVFKDDKELKIGKPISSELLNAIEESRFSIVVFSRNYACSTWCLDELAKIVECKNTLGQMVIPIFYDVNQSVEREQMGNFEEAFAKHEKAFRDNIEKVETWRSALIEVINLPGRDLKDRYEAEFIEGIVKEISSELSGSTSTPIFMNLKELIVGVNSCLENLRVQWVPAAIAPPLTSPFFFFLFIL